MLGNAHAHAGSSVAVVGDALRIRGKWCKATRSATTGVWTPIYHLSTLSFHSVRRRCKFIVMGVIVFAPSRISCLLSYVPRHRLCDCETDVERHCKTVTYLHTYYRAHLLPPATELKFTFSDYPGVDRDREPLVATRLINLFCLLH